MTNNNTLKKNAERGVLFFLNYFVKIITQRAKSVQRDFTVKIEQMYENLLK